MSTFLFAAALVALQSVPAQSTPQAEAQPYVPPVALSAESNAALRCSAAFALVSYGQANNNEAARQWPDLDERGREFFVRTMAQIMDETGMGREDAARMAQAEAQRLLDSGEIDQVMPACLAMLDLSGL